MLGDRQINCSAPGANMQHGITLDPELDAVRVVKSRLSPLGGALLKLQQNIINRDSGHILA